MVRTGKEIPPLRPASGAAQLADALAEFFERQRREKEGAVLFGEEEEEEEERREREVLGAELRSLSRAQVYANEARLTVHTRKEYRRVRWARLMFWVGFGEKSTACRRVCVGLSINA